MDRKIIEEHNLCYINISSLLIDLFNLLNDYNLSILKSKDIKKLSFNFYVCYLIKHFQTNNYKEKSIFYIEEEVYNSLEQNIKDCLSKTFNLLKKYTSIPFIILNENIFNKKDGHLEEINLKNKLYFDKTNYSIKNIQKYIKKEEYYHLVNLLKEINNIRIITTK